MSKGVKSNAEVKSSSFFKEVSGMALVLFSVLSLLCLITGDALFYTLGTSVQGFLLGVFGVYSFFVLADLALWGLKLASGKSVVSKRVRKKYFLIRVAIVCVFAILNLAISLKAEATFGEQISAAYTGGLAGFAGTSVAGVFGVFLNAPLVALASYFGTYFLYGVTILLCVAYVFGEKILSVFAKKDKRPAKPQKKGKKTTDTEIDDVGEITYEPYFFDEDGSFMKKSKKEIQSRVINNITPFTGEFYFKDDPQPEKSGAQSYARPAADPRGEIGKYSYVDADGYGDNDGKIDLKKQKDKLGGLGSDFSDYGYGNYSGDYGKRSEVSGVIQKEGDFKNALDEIDDDKKVYTVPFDKGDIAPATHREQSDAEFYSDSGENDGISKRDLYGETYDGGYGNGGFDGDNNGGAAAYFGAKDRSDAVNAEEDIFDKEEDFSDFSDVYPKKTEVKTFERERGGDTDGGYYDGYGPAARGARSFYGEDNAKDTPEFVSGVARNNPPVENEIADDGSEPIENMPLDYQYNAPPIDILEEYKQDPQKAWEETTRQKWCIDTIIKVIKTKKNIDVQVENVTTGPAVSRYDISVPEPHGPSEILALRQDLAFRLQTGDELRMYSVPRTSYIGIEIANKHARTVGLRDSLLSQDYADTMGKSGLHFIFGEDLLGNTIVMDLNSMPHLLVCGTTGSGKSVCLNVMLISLMYRYSPAELRIIIVDPKMVEFQSFKGAPHLVFNEILGTDDRTISVLDWCVEEMERRYKAMANLGCKDIFEYNKKTKEKKMPCLLILIDEYADLVNAQQQNKKKIETCIDRLAAKARAAGISLVLAMQRASASVISGTIKTNIVSRICFQTGSGVDSRVILDEQGAEKLLGKGDALYRLKGAGNLKRGQGAFMSNDEAKNVLNYIIENNKCYYDNKLLKAINDSVRQEEEGEVIGSSRSAIRGMPSRPDEVDEDYKLALRFAIKRQVVSGSSLRTTLRIGYNKSAAIINWMEKMGYISPILENRMRKVLFTREDYENTYGEFIEDDF